ncbi:MAG: acyl carrier protein [Ignavibacteriales bacterium]|nr:MAG: acyl carrier protein [Ignavibacteriales bacterium]
MDKLIEILTDIRPDVDFANEEKLIDNAVLDSFDIVSIISVLNDEFDISIRVNELGPENFNSAGAIMKMVERLQQK